MYIFQNWKMKEIHCSEERHEQRYKFTLLYFPDVNDIFINKFCELCFKNESFEDQRFKLAPCESSLQKLTVLFIYDCRHSL